jgi:penicillin-binding protein 2
MINLNSAQGNPRRLVFYGGILLVVLILTGGFYNLQILQENVYSGKSEENSVKRETQIPVRGLIYDRNGRLIVDNRPSFSLYLVPAQTTSQTTSALSEILGIDENQIKKNFRRSRRFQPIKIARYVDMSTLTILQENKLYLPGLEWKVEPKRHYYYNRSFAHILGTLGEIGEEELNANPEYEPGDLIGKKGVEQALDDQLRGKKGYRYVKVDALGRTVSAAENLSPSKKATPLPGYNLYLSIDARLQLFTDSLFGDHTGALVAIDVSNGEIITMVSKPDYDLNLFAEAIEPELWNQLMADSLKPLFDRATQATYPPGSTYKMITAIAALNEGIITPQWTIYCPGYYRIGQRVIRCWKGDGHGEMNLISAIKNSCNVYFYQLGLKIGIDHWNRYSQMFRFGKKTGIELKTEKAGLVPSKEYYNKVYGKSGWTKGLLANVAIGQGELLVTPLQMALFAMILANSGTYYHPHLTKRLVNKVSNKTDSLSNPSFKLEGIKPEVFEFIREGMRRVVAGGTGWRASVWRMSGAGKTGTAQNPHGVSHAWFIGFVPFEEPEIAIAIIIEHGGSGGGAAAPLAGEYFRRYFYYQGKFDYDQYREYLRKLWEKQKEQARLDSLRAAGVLVPGDSTNQVIGD